MTSPESDKQHDRATTWKVAIVSAAAAVLAVLIGGAASYVVADKQVASQERQSQADFLRAQRQTAYAKFVADTADLLTAVRVSDEQQAVAPTAEQVGTRVAAVQAETEQLDLLAGSDTRQHAAAMYNALRDLRDKYSSASDCPAAACTAAAAQEVAAITNLSNALSDFTEAARAELGVGP